MGERLTSVEHETAKHGSLVLYKPKDYARVVQIQRLAVEHDEPVLACAAALGLAWQSGPTDKKPRANWVKLKGAWRFGESVMNELIGRGWSMMEVINAGNAALPVVLDLLHDMLGEDEVKAAEGFTETGEGSP
jgi:hypothetical protein